MIANVIMELQRQDEKWGSQRHLPFIGEHREKMPRRYRVGYYAEREIFWKSVNDSPRSERDTGWDSILLEEVFEALAATEVADQVTELVQVAAVAIQAAMALEAAA